MKIDSKYARRRRVVADDELEMDDVEVVDEPIDEAEADVDVDPEASDLLFEAEDVAELVAEVTGQPVEVTTDEDSVIFKVAEDTYTVTPEGDEEVLESTRRPLRGKRPVRAARRLAPRRPVKASTKSVIANRGARRTARTSRRIPSSK